jgi:hypothetical protein
MSSGGITQRGRTALGRSLDWRCIAALAAAVTTLACSATAATAAPLPEGRVYEQVSPVEKEGYAAGAHNPFTVALNGEAVAFSSPGTFLGAQSDKGYNAYLARRTGSGWSTVPDSLPTTLEYNGSSLEDVSANLEQAVGLFKVAPNQGRNNEAHEAFFALYRPDHTYVQLPAEALKALTSVPGSEDYVGVGSGILSADLSHLIFNSKRTTLLPEDTTLVYNKLYAVAGVGGANPRLELIGKDSEGKVLDPECDVELGGRETTFNSIDADGSEVFFTTGVNPSEGSTCLLREVLVRVNGETTLEISKPPVSPDCGEAHPCSGANRVSASFQGASQDGSRAFFTTTAALLPTDKDGSNDLYMAEIDREAGKVAVTKLVQVSHDSNLGQAAEVQGVVRVSSDGTRVYFVARGVLTEGANVEGAEPAQGADNLYVYEPDPEHPGQYKTAFIADLCSGLKASGAVSGDTQCPGSGSDAELWAQGNNEAQTAGGGGRFLAFTGYGQLTADDHDSAKDVYRYDAREGRLERVSIGEAGHDANGNNNAFDAHITAPTFFDGKLATDLELRSRAISEDGSKILFTTAEPLSPRAVNGQIDIYEWHEGQVSLISSGTSPEADGYPVITPSGRDIFFDSVAGLVPQDVDGVRDVYDARAEGGFPIQPAAPAGCGGGESCRGGASVAPLFQAPATVTQPAEGGVQPVAKAVKRKPKPKRKARKKGRRAKTSLAKGRGAKRAQSATWGGRR